MMMIMMMTIGCNCFFQIISIIPGFCRRAGPCFLQRARQANRSKWQRQAPAPPPLTTSKTATKSTKYVWDMYDFSKLVYVCEWQGWFVWRWCMYLTSFDIHLSRGCFFFCSFSCLQVRKSLRSVDGGVWVKSLDMSEEAGSFSWFHTSDISIDGQPVVWSFLPLLIVVFCTTLLCCRSSGISSMNGEWMLRFWLMDIDWSHGHPLSRMDRQNSWNTKPKQLRTHVMSTCQFPCCAHQEWHQNWSEGMSMWAVKKKSLVFGSFRFCRLLYYIDTYIYIHTLITPFIGNYMLYPLQENPVYKPGFHIGPPSVRLFGSCC